MNDLAILSNVNLDTIIREDNLIITGGTIAGYVTTKNNVYIAPNAFIVNPVEVGGRAVIGAGAIIKKSVKSEVTMIPVESQNIIDYIDIVKCIKTKK